MSEFHESKIVPLAGAANGVNKVFTTPTSYLPGTIRVLWNGNVYESDDERFGWTEISETKVETNEAPKSGDVMTCFYQELSPVPGIANVVGSPFDPSGNYP